MIQGVMSDAEAARVLLRTAWSALGGDADLLDRVTVTGDGTGLLPAALPALPAMVAAVAASTLAVSVLDATRRTGAPMPVLVDAEHVAVAGRSEVYAHAEGPPPAGQFAPLSRFWRTADGWLRLHTNYPWHHRRALRVLGCADHPDAVARAIGGWRGEELEDALAAAGAVGYAVRSRQQWQRHPQGRAVAARPLVDSVAGPGPHGGVGPGTGATGLRVLDLTRVIAGPVATRTLAAWGAEVLRLDSPHLPETPAQTLDTLSGKRSALLDLSGPAGRTRLDVLLAAADVLVAGYRPGALARYGLAPEALAERHPHLSVVTLSAWGVTGPWAARRGFDSVVQGASGIAGIEAADGRPGTLPAQVLDHATGYLAAAAALLALAGVARGEPPRSVRLSLAQTAHWLMAVGGTARQEAREMCPNGHRVTLPGAARPVCVITPPGRVGDLVPRWVGTTDFGADPPAFALPASHASRASRRPDPGSQPAGPGTVVFSPPDRVQRAQPAPNRAGTVRQQG
jgi:crotonobetainyl-CoA:carnitine CoA-transferase CaiB-like acyl-CoA transferase